ncbi:hypothetical protein [Streptomyces sp. NPDC056632]|uniref:hypothetical protein n=1 Tax=Streptomyces sp. NPDC056632 TaxID=3345884 RepID=UPI0036B4553B
MSCPATARRWARRGQVWRLPPGADPDDVPAEESRIPERLSETPRIRMEDEFGLMFVLPIVILERYDLCVRPVGLAPS